METRVLIQPASKHYAAFPPVMLRIKFDQDWPTGFRDIQVWNVDDGLLVYYKLTLWAFDSGELKSGNIMFSIISLWGKKSVVKGD